jgi:hypothetical protein
MVASFNHRRWFQCRLRTLFVLMALACLPCAWVGHSLEWIRQRRLLLSSIHHRPSEPCGFSGGGLYTPAPAGLGLFGEQGVRVVIWKSNPYFSPEKSKQLFPEALVIYGTPWAALTERRKQQRHQPAETGQ